MDSRYREEFLSSMTGGLTTSLLCCGLLRPGLLRFLRLRLRLNRRKPDYSRPVDDVAIGIEARSVTRAVPGFFGVVPVHDAIEVCAHRRVKVNLAVLVAICSNLSATTTDY